MNELYELPDGWEWKKIRDVFKIKSGNFLPKKSMISEGQYNVYGGNGITGKHNEHNLIGENIIIGRVGALCGNVRKINETIWITDNAFYISDYKIDINKVFLSKYLSFINLGKTANQAAQPVISYKGISQLNIPLPPLQEQKRIVLKLDTLFEKIDKAIALHQKNIDEVDVFMGSVLNEVFGELEERYEVVAVGTVTDCIVPQRNKPKQFIGDIKWITTDDLILFNRVSKSSKGLGLRREEIEESQSKIIPKESVLMSCVGYLGMVSIADVEMVVNQQLHTFQCSELINNKFLMYALYVKQNYMYSIANITTVAYMNKSKCNSIPIPMAPLQVQQKTVKYLDQLSEKTEILKQVQNNEMESLKALKASILDRAFRGEL